MEKKIRLDGKRPMCSPLIMISRNTVARGLGFVMVLAGCGSSTGVNLVTDGPVVLSGLSDEFDDSGSISDWLVRAQFEGG